jgi:multiple antibiotic resistance protein
MDFLENLLFAFIPLFVAMDIIGALPIYLGLTADMTDAAKRRIVKQATLVAAVIGLAFLFTGKGVFALLGVTVADFKVAGGILLLVLSILDIIKSREERRVMGDEIGIVPLGMPLIIGPAALAALGDFDRGVEDYVYAPGGDRRDDDTGRTTRDNARFIW